VTDGGRARPGPAGRQRSELGPTGRQPSELGIDPDAEVVRPRSGRPSLAARLGPPALVAAAILVGWQLYVTMANVDPIVLPSPTRILGALVDYRDLAVEHTLPTLFETVAGFTVSVVAAVSVAVVMDQLEPVRRALYPLLVASQTIPILAVAPLMIIWFGFGLLPKVIVIVLVTFFPIVVALLDGFASTRPEAMDLLRTMGADRGQAFRKVRLPTALPSFFTGLRIAITYAVIGAVFAEYVGAYQGLGIWMQLSKNAFRTDLVFVAILITAILSIALFFVVGVVERLVIPWYRESLGSA
jgi:ABC-type nitrate/sulfonate/bicarbonate transport system permease component